MLYTKIIINESFHLDYTTKASEKDISNSSEAWEKLLETNLRNITLCCPHAIVEESRES